MEKCRAETAAREAKAYAAPSRGRSFGLGIGERNVGVGRHEIGVILAGSHKVASTGCERTLLSDLASAGRQRTGLGVNGNLERAGLSDPATH